MMIRRTLLAASTITLAFGAAACSSSDSGSTASTPVADTQAAETSASDPAVTEAAGTEAPADAALAAGGAAVGILNSRFDPLELSVAVGDTVTFTNGDGFSHTVTSKDDSTLAFDSGKIGQDETFDVEFTEAGTYNYFCQIHPTMRASVIVG